MRHFVHTRVFAAPAAVAALALGVTVPAASRVLIPASRRAQRFTPSGAAATCSAIALASVAARADEHLAPASGTQKQSGIVHRSPRRGGLDDPRSPGNTALGAVRQCGSGRSLGRDRQVNVVRGCAGLPDHCDLTPTAERRHRTGAPRRHLLVGNIGSGRRQRQAPGRGTGTTQSSSAPIPQSRFTRAVRRITALSQSRLQAHLPTVGDDAPSPQEFVRVRGPFIGNGAPEHDVGGLVDGELGALDEVRETGSRTSQAYVTGRDGGPSGRFTESTFGPDERPNA